MYTARSFDHSKYCRICKRGFGSMQALEQHTRDKGHDDNSSASSDFTDSDEDDNMCYICGRGFVSSTALRQHVENSPRHKGRRDSGLMLKQPVGVSFGTTSGSDSFTDLANELTGMSLCGHRVPKLKDQSYEDMVDEFQSRFGGDEPMLEDWQALCAMLGAEGIPLSITKCKKKLQTFHVNLVDLIAASRTGVKPKMFRSVGELAKYTFGAKKKFPKDVAKQGKILKVMLREIS